VIAEDRDEEEKDIDRARRLFLKGMAALGLAVPTITLLLRENPEEQDPITQLPPTTPPPR
jgi:hypothetical protein